MNYKTAILENICYTALVYGRINKKLNSRLSTSEIEAMLYETKTGAGNLPAPVLS